MVKYYVHESSFVDEEVKIGMGTKIWHFSHIMREAKLGGNCVLGQNTFVGSKVIIGDNCRIQNNVSIYEGVTLEDEVFCGPSCVFTNVTNPRSLNSVNGNYAKTLVKKGATIGANSTIVCGITLGDYCFIGAGTVVTKSVPDYGLVYGSPSKLKGWVCSCGTKIIFEKNQGTCPSCGSNFISLGEDKITPVIQKEDRN